MSSVQFRRSTELTNKPALDHTCKSISSGQGPQEHGSFITDALLAMMMMMKGVIDRPDVPLSVPGRKTMLNKASTLLTTFPISSPYTS